MYIGDFEKVASWDSQAVKGCKRFLDRIWNLAESADPSEEISAKNEAAIHKTIKKVGDDIENMKFNTAIAAMMALINDFSSNGATRGDMKVLLKLLAPFAPHMAEELWENYGEKTMLAISDWPKYDESKTRASEVEIAVQVCGKIKARITIPADISDDEAIAIATAEPKVKEALENGKLVKSIVVKNRLVNLIIK